MSHTHSLKYKMYIVKHKIHVQFIRSTCTSYHISFTAKDIPFKDLHTPPVPFGTIRRNCWIPGISIQVRLTACERHQAHIKIFSPNL